VGVRAPIKVHSRSKVLHAINPYNGGNPMFIVMPFKPEDWEDALFILSHYYAHITMRCDGEYAHGTYMIVSPLHPDVEQIADQNLDVNQQYHLAKMCFQMNWHQHSERICPDCDKHADKFDTCGHLAFSEPIDPAF